MQLFISLVKNWADNDVDEEGKPTEAALDRLWLEAPTNLGKLSIQVLGSFRNAFSRRIRKCMGKPNLW